jgi:hypothetical protein
MTEREQLIEKMARVMQGSLDSTAKVSDYTAASSKVLDVAAPVLLAIDVSTHRDRSIWDKCFDDNEDKTNRYPRDKGFCVMENFMNRRLAQYTYAPDPRREVTIKYITENIPGGNAQQIYDLADGLLAAIDAAKRAK